MDRSGICPRSIRWGRSSDERRCSAHPAIAYLTRSAIYDAGVVISASHNPYQDNGIKIFSGTGKEIH
jgi:phosphomannomutase